MATAYTLAANATLRDIGNTSIWGVATARTGLKIMRNSQGDIDNVTVERQV